MQVMMQRVGAIEEQQDDIDIDQLLGKESINVADIIGIIKQNQAEMLKQTVS